VTHLIHLEVQKMKRGSTKPTTNEVAVDQNNKPPIKVNREDGAAMKRVLDDAVIKYITEGAKFQEDTKYGDITLVLSAISVALALTAQFYPAAFPQNYFVLLICATSYFILSGILQYILMYIEKDNIIFTVGEQVDSHGLEIATKLPRFDYNYTISISEKNTHKNQTTITKSVGNFIDTEGVFHEELLNQALKDLIDQYNQNENKRK